VSDIDTGVVDSLKVLDPRRPIREADINRAEIPQCSGFLPILRLTLACASERQRGAQEQINGSK